MDVTQNMEEEKEIWIWLEIWRSNNKNMDLTENMEEEKEIWIWLKIWRSNNKYGFDWKYGGKEKWIWLEIWRRKKKYGFEAIPTSLKVNLDSNSLLRLLKRKD